MPANPAEVRPAAPAAAPPVIPAQRTTPRATVSPPPAAAPAPAGLGALARLLTGHGLATAAQTATSLAAGAYVLERTGSASWASTTVAVGVLPYVVLSGLAGLLADLVSRSTVLAWSCLLRAVLTGASVAVMLTDGPVGWLVVLAALTAAAATPAYPAVAASVTQCVPDEALERSNAVTTGVENLAWIAGPGLFGLLTLAGLGPATVAGVAALTCAAAAAAVAAVRLPVPRRRGPHRGWVAEGLAGLRLVAAGRRLRAAMGLAVVDNFLYGYLVVSLVLLGEQRGGLDPGASTTALTVGALLAVVVAGPLARRVPVARLVSVALVVFAATAGLVGLTGATWPALALVAAAGATTLLAEIAAVTLLQRDSDPGLVARVFGVYDQLNVGAIAVGSALAGPLSQLLGAGPSLALVAAGCAVPVAALARGATAP